MELFLKSFRFSQISLSNVLDLLVGSIFFIDLVPLSGLDTCRRMKTDLGERNEVLQGAKRKRRPIKTWNVIRRGTLDKVVPH